MSLFKKPLKGTIVNRRLSSLYGGTHESTFYLFENIIKPLPNQMHNTSPNIYHQKTEIREVRAEKPGHGADLKLKSITGALGNPCNL